MNEPISATALRIIIAAIGVVILIVIWMFGRPRRADHGRRLWPRRHGDPRIEPVLGDAGADPAANAAAGPRQGELDMALQRELDRLGATVTADREAGVAAPAVSQPPVVAAPEEPREGRRPHEFPVDRIVTLYVAAHEGEAFGGSDIAVAAEKAGLRFGAMHIFHRLVDGRPEAGPVFSMANMLKPGYFDMGRLADLRTRGVTFFATLPGPVSALDAWDAMLPAAQRIAELLGGELLDEDRNTLGRQRIAGLREELRLWDRRHEGEPIPPLRG